MRERVRHALETRGLHRARRVGEHHAGDSAHARSLTEKLRRIQARRTAVGYGPVRAGELVETGLRTAVGLVGLPLGIAVLSLYAIWLAGRGLPVEEVHRRSYLRCARLGALLSGNSIEVHGKEKIVPGQAYVVVSNHESNMDPFALIAGLWPLVLRFIVKQEIMRVPIFGHALRATGNVTVERTQTQGDVRRIQEFMQGRIPGVSVIFFAEGTRSRSGAFQPFKKGAFATAIHEKLPILPVALSTRRTLPPNRFYLRPGTWIIEVGEPIPTEHLGLSDRDGLLRQTRESVGKLRARVRQRMRDRGLDPGGLD
jgi:1-acyl-sn-glycerol-3-phosphate acyltransferase